MSQIFLPSLLLFALLKNIPDFFFIRFFLQMMAV